MLNSGISFGWLPGLPSWVLAGVLIGLGYFAVKVRELVGKVGVILVLIGGCGNLYQRITYGVVQDNLNFFGLFYNNIFDYAISVGVIVFVTHLFIAKEMTRENL